jgi:hypothetical protein
MRIPSEEMLKAKRGTARKMRFFLRPAYRGPRPEPTDPSLTPIIWTALRHARQGAGAARQHKIFILKTKIEHELGLDDSPTFTPVDEFRVLAHAEGLFAGLQAGFLFHQLAVEMEKDSRLRFILRYLRKNPAASAEQICKNLDWQIGRQSRQIKKWDAKLRLIVRRIADIVPKHPAAGDEATKMDEAAQVERAAKYLDGQIEPLCKKNRPPLPLPSWGIDSWIEALGENLRTRDERIRNCVYNYLNEKKDQFNSEDYQLLLAWEKAFDRRGKPKRRRPKIGQQIVN